jgi:hypothetical protein
LGPMLNEIFLEKYFMQHDMEALKGLNADKP